jgi:hypothetical protein
MYGQNADADADQMTICSDGRVVITHVGDAEMMLIPGARHMNALMRPFAASRGRMSKAWGVTLPPTNTYRLVFALQPSEARPRFQATVTSSDTEVEWLSADYLSTYTLHSSPDSTQVLLRSPSAEGVLRRQDGLPLVWRIFDGQDPAPVSEARVAAVAWTPEQWHAEIRRRCGPSDPVESSLQLDPTELELGYLLRDGFLARAATHHEQAPARELTDEVLAALSEATGRTVVPQGTTKEAWDLGTRRAAAMLRRACGQLKIRPELDHAVVRALEVMLLEAWAQANVALWRDAAARGPK